MNNEEANKIEKEIQNSDARKTYKRISYLIDVYRIQEVNFINLHRLLLAFNSPVSILPIWDIDKRDVLDSAILELIRQIHNYLASVGMLIDHTRILIDEYYSQTDFYKEYQVRKDNTFACDMLSCFFHRLRNYILHISIPNPFSKIEMSIDPVSKKQITSSKVMIRKTDLLLWSGWTEEARKYLEGSPEELDLLTIFNLYHEKIKEFNNWLIGRLKTIHSDDLNWLREKSNQLMIFYNEMKTK